MTHFCFVLKLIVTALLFASTMPSLAQQVSSFSQAINDLGMFYASRPDLTGFHPSFFQGIQELTAPKAVINSQQLRDPTQIQPGERKEIIGSFVDGKGGSQVPNRTPAKAKVSVSSQGIRPDGFLPSELSTTSRIARGEEVLGPLTAAQAEKAVAPSRYPMAGAEAVIAARNLDLTQQFGRWWNQRNVEQNAELIDLGRINTGIAVVRGAADIAGGLASRGLIRFPNKTSEYPPLPTR